MKADISRFRFDRGKNYTSVVAQQGRVQLDSDANEQRAIDAWLRATGLVDIVGRTGAPRHDAGFAITVPSAGDAIQIGAAFKGMEHELIGKALVDDRFVRSVDQKIDLLR